MEKLNLENLNKLIGMITDGKGKVSEMEFNDWINKNSKSFVVEIDRTNDNVTNGELYLKENAQYALDLSKELYKNPKIQNFWVWQVVYVNGIYQTPTTLKMTKEVFNKLNADMNEAELQIKKVGNYKYLYDICENAIDQRFQ